MKDLGLKNFKSRLSKAGIIYCFNKKEKTCEEKPPLFLFENIPLMWDFLRLIVEDWSKESSPYKKKIDLADTEEKKRYFFLQSFSALQPYYLKCLFSYVMFFCSLIDAYDFFYKNLNEINSIPNLIIKHKKKPKRTEYIKKVKIIRNISIAHLGDLKSSYSKENSIAVTQWQPMSIEERDWDIDNITFLPGRTRLRNTKGEKIGESKDLEIKGISELHGHCSKYLDEYDLACEEYLEGILELLPLENNNFIYSKVKTDFMLDGK